MEAWFSPTGTVAEQIQPLAAARFAGCFAADNGQPFVSIAPPSWPTSTDKPARRTRSLGSVLHLVNVGLHEFFQLRRLSCILLSNMLKIMLHYLKSKIR